MLFLWFLSVVLSTICTVSGELDPQCDESCNCCLDTLCYESKYFKNHCKGGCIDGHRGPRCYELCQYENCKSCGGHTDSKVCTECKDGYHLGPNKDCTSQCPSNCKLCTSSTQSQSYKKCLQCKEGKYGETCQEDCSIGCRDKTCSIDLGACVCTTNFTGDKCMKCYNGTYGQFCNQTCHKDCKGQICERTSGYCSDGCFNENISGTTCNTCIVGTFGELCDKICPENCKDFRCERYSGICIDGCTPNFNGTKCDQCIHGKYGTNCELNCPAKCTEAQQQNDASNSGLVATAAVLGSMFMLSFAVNIVLLALFLLKKRNGSRRKHSWTEREPTYQNQLQDIAEQIPRTTREATDTLHSETVERSVYEGISGVNEEEHEYQKLNHGHGNML